MTVATNVKWLNNPIKNIKCPSIWEWKVYLRSVTNFRLIWFELNLERHNYRSCGICTQSFKLFVLCATYAREWSWLIELIIRSVNQGYTHAIIFACVAHNWDSFKAFELKLGKYIRYELCHFKFVLDGISLKIKADFKYP